MLDTYASLQQQRSLLLDQMGALDRMERGRLSEQFLKGQKEGQPVLRGPYYVLQRRLGPEIRKERVPLDRLPVVQADIQGHAEFQRLAERYAQTTEEMTRWQDAHPDFKKSPPLPSRSVPGNPGLLNLGQAEAGRRGGGLRSLAG